MICYHDRQYCTAACANDQCSLMLTEAVKEGARKAQLPISMGDRSKHCEIYMPIRPSTPSSSAETGDS
jgi:hypothetical protein